MIHYATIFMKCAFFFSDRWTNFYSNFWVMSPTDCFFFLFLFFPSALWVYTQAKRESRHALAEIFTYKIGRFVFMSQREVHVYIYNDLEMLSYYLGLKSSMQCHRIRKFVRFSHFDSWWGNVDTTSIPPCKQVAGIQDSVYRQPSWWKWWTWDLKPIILLAKSTHCPW